MIDKFSNFGWVVHLKNKIAQTASSFEVNFLGSKTKPNLFETDGGKKICTQTFSYFSEYPQYQNIPHYTAKVVVFAEFFKRTIVSFYKTNFKNVSSINSKKYKNLNKSITKLTPVKISLKQIEKLVLRTIKRKGIKKCKLSFN